MAALEPHICSSDMNQYFAGNMDVIETTRLEIHCRKCDECNRKRILCGLSRILEWQTVSAVYKNKGCFNDKTLHLYCKRKLTEGERFFVGTHILRCFDCSQKLRKHEFKEESLRKS